RTVEEVLEVMSGLFTISARLAAERADAEQRRALGELLAELERTESPDEQVLLIHQLGDLMVDAADNLILKLVRRGVRTRVLERMEPHGFPSAPPEWSRRPQLRELARAIDERDGAAASEAVYELSTVLRQHALVVIEAERSRREVRRARS
ncbi:MAG: FCD domain-containing protein, partial [bacterium]|nr:FCD domain-containing protein [bacterium]